MTLETYDDDVALRAYIFQHYRHLMTPLERRVTEYIAPVVSEATETEVPGLYEWIENRDGHVVDADIYAAFQTPYDTRVRNATMRIAAEHADKLHLNRCAKCGRLVRKHLLRYGFRL